MEDSRQLGALGATQVRRVPDSWLDELGSRAGRGDREAFAQIYSNLVDDIYGYVRGLCRDQYVTEDIVADVFLRAWRSAATYRESSGTFRAWIFTIARNQVRTHWRDSKATVDLLAEDLVDLSPFGPVNDGPDSVVTAALGALTPEQREAIVLRYFSGKSHEEIAELMGKRPGAVRALVMRALRRMRKAVDGVAT